MYEISVIIPVFNTEAYLEQCLDSVCRSTVFPLCEVLVIDDGSSDRSLELARGYEARYDNLFVYSTSRCGASGARNHGIQKAKGRYLFFLDSDDWIDPEYLQKLYDCIEALHCDMICAGCSHVEGGQAPVPRVKSILSRDHVISGCEYLEKRMDADDWDNEVWCNLYRRSFLEYNQILFCEKIWLYEDILFTNRALLYATRVAALPEYGYHYRIRKDSLIRRALSEADVKNCMLVLKQFCNEYGCYSRVQKHAAGRVYFRIVSMILYNIGELQAEQKKMQMGQEKKYYRRLSKLQLWKPLLFSISNGKEAVKWLIFRIHWSLYYPLVKKPSEQAAEENPLVSVIIPCYNAERTLKQCLDSVLNQTYRNLEVLVIDDGSADQSRAILQFYAKKDGRVHPVFHTHQGVSCARNMGLSQARGQYLQFVDADDCLLDNATELLVAGMQRQKADWVIGDYLQIPEEEHIHLPAGFYKKRRFLKKLMRYPNAHYYGVLWNKLYRRQIIVEKGFQFPEEVSMGEDFIFNMEYLSQVQKICCLKETLYVYRRQQEHSLSGKSKDEPEKIAERVRMYEAYREMFSREKLDRLWRYGILYYAVKYYFDELEALGDRAAVYQPLLYEQYIRNNQITGIEFAGYYLLKKGKRIGIGKGRKR